MKSDYKLISLSQKDRIKTIVFNLITGAIILFLLVYYLVQGISMHLDKAIIGSILLLIGITIVMIFFLRDVKEVLSFPDWKVVFDQTGIYCNDKAGEFSIEWAFVKKIIIVNSRGEILIMEVITNAEKHREIDLEFCSVYVPRVRELIRVCTCEKCEVIVK